MEQVQVEIGDMIRIQGFGYNHVGIYVGCYGAILHCVVHNCKGIGVMASSLEEFSAGKNIFMHQKATVPHHERQTIVNRALSLLNTQYDLINFNCEHAAYYAQNGEAKSPQIAGAAVLGLAAVSLFALSAFSSKKA
jgi:hypothetical protein